MKRKMLVIFAFVCAAFILFPTVSYASRAPDDLWADYLEILPSSDGSETPDGVLSDIGVDAVFSEIASAIGACVSPVASFFAFVMALSALLAVAEAASPSELQNKRNVSAVSSVIIP